MVKPSICHSEICLFHINFKLRSPEKKKQHIFVGFLMNWLHVCLTVPWHVQKSRQQYGRRFSASMRILERACRLPGSVTGSFTCQSWKDACIRTVHIYKRNLFLWGRKDDRITTDLDLNLHSKSNIYSMSSFLAAFGQTFSDFLLCYWE